MAAAGSIATYKTMNTSADTRKLRLVYNGEINIAISATEDLKVAQEKFAQ